MDYKEKYLKYKNRYLKLKRNLSGGYVDINKKETYVVDKINNNHVLNIKRDKFFDIVDTLQHSKEDNLKYKIIIENQKNEINDIKTNNEELNNKLKEMKDIYILNEKLTIMDIENGYGKIY